MNAETYSRADLPRFQTMARADVFSVLRSFDGHGLADEEFTRQSLALLDADRVPGLAEVRTAGDVSGALDAVVRACRCEPPVEKTPVNPAFLETADNVLMQRFSFYGETHDLPADLDWELNPGTAHWGHDLHRFSYLGPLTQASLATGDARYAGKALALILDWIRKCDFGRSFVIEKYAFGSYLNLAIHAGAWARTVSRLVAIGQVAPLDLLRVLKSLHDHLAYLEIVTRGHAGNWPTIGCMGMLSVLEHLPVFRDADRFTTYCRTMLAEQVAQQVLPDGVQDELTPHYHQVVVNNLVSACRSLRALGTELTPETLATLRMMVRYSQQTVVPDGSKHVAFNDSDPAAVPRLRDQLAAVGLDHYLRPDDALGPDMYPYAGVAFLRQRADRGDLYLAFDAGPFGRGHQHEDKLGLWLFAYGRNLLVDPGRHLYDRSAVSFYPYLTSTRAHSTILVDGHGQNSRAHPATWISRQSIDLEWSVDDDRIRAAGVYDLGYGPQNAIAVVHRREIVMVGERCWVLFDRLTGDGAHTIEARFQFAPGKLVLEDGRARTAFPDANLLVWTIGPRPPVNLHIEEGRRDPIGGWYSDGYNRIEPAPALSMTWRESLPVCLATLLLPYRGPTPPSAAFTFDGNRAVIRLGDWEATVSVQPLVV